MNLFDSNFIEFNVVIKDTLQQTQEMPFPNGQLLNSLITLISLFSLLIVFGVNYVQFPTDIIKSIGNKKNNGKNKVKKKLLFFFYTVDMFGIGLVVELLILFFIHSIIFIVKIDYIPIYEVPIFSIIWIIYLICKAISIRKSQLLKWGKKDFRDFKYWTSILWVLVVVNLSYICIIVLKKSSYESYIGITLLNIAFFLFGKILAYIILSPSSELIKYYDLE